MSAAYGRSGNSALVSGVNFYPNVAGIIRTFNVGGVPKSELINELRRNSILMNAAAERLLASVFFTAAETRYPITTVELAVHNLSLPRGGALHEIYERAMELGLSPCPLEAGPHLRLQYHDQPEGHWGKPVRKNRAPYGSITMASEHLTEDDEFPKGFYLRRIAGRLWLRGYHSSPEHAWDAEDHFVFMQK